MTKFDERRSLLMVRVAKCLEDAGEEVLRTGSQEICVPIVTSDGDEGYVVIAFKVPKGSREGDPYDGYEMADEYKRKCAAKAETAAKRAAAKAAKIERDRKVREAKAKAKAERIAKG